eukprot:430142_1
MSSKKGRKRDNADLLSTNKTNDNTQNPRPSKRHRRDKDNIDLLSIDKTNDNTQNPCPSERQQRDKDKNAQIPIEEQHDSSSTELDSSDSSNEFEEEYKPQKQQTYTSTKSKKKLYYVNNANNTNVTENIQSRHRINGTTANYLQPTQQTQSANNVTVNKSHYGSLYILMVAILIVAGLIALINNFINENTETNCSAQSTMPMINTSYPYRVRVRCNGTDSGYMRFSDVGIITYDFSCSVDLVCQIANVYLNATDKDAFFLIFNQGSMTIFNKYICKVKGYITLDICGKKHQELHAVPEKLKHQVLHVLYWKLHPMQWNQDVYQLQAWHMNSDGLQEPLGWASFDEYGWGPGFKWQGIIDEEQKNACEYSFEKISVLIEENKTYSINVSCPYVYGGTSRLMSYLSSVGWIGYSDRYSLSDSMFSFEKVYHGYPYFHGTLFHIRNKYQGLYYNYYICYSIWNSTTLFKADTERTCYKSDDSLFQNYVCKTESNEFGLVLCKDQSKAINWILHPMDDKNIYKLEAFIRPHFFNYKADWFTGWASFVYDSDFDVFTGSLVSTQWRTCRYFVQRNMLYT